MSIFTFLTTHWSDLFATAREAEQHVNSAPPTSYFYARCGRFEGNGSRIRFLLNGIKATFHRPHPQKETDKGAVKSVRRFLEEGGIRP